MSSSQRLRCASVRLRPKCFWTMPAWLLPDLLPRRRLPGGPKADFGVRPVAVGLVSGRAAAAERAPRRRTGLGGVTQVGVELIRAVLAQAHCVNLGRRRGELRPATLVAECPEVRITAASAAGRIRSGKSHSPGVFARKTSGACVTQKRAWMQSFPLNRTERSSPSASSAPVSVSLMSAPGFVCPSQPAFKQDGVHGLCVTVTVSSLGVRSLDDLSGCSDGDCVGGSLVPLRRAVPAVRRRCERRHESGRCP